MRGSKVLKSTGKPARQRKPAKGATRKVKSVVKPKRSFAWVNRVLVLLGVGVVLAAVAKAAVILHAIPVERIVMTGNIKNTQTVALQEMVQPALVGGFLSANLQRIRGQIESLPWVYRASVKRQWPNALEIHVIEQLPIARWGEDGFLNHEGQVFLPARGGNWDSLPVLTGPKGAQQELIIQYQLITEALQPVELEVTALSLDMRGQVKAMLDGGIEVAYGDDSLRERLERFVSLYRVELSRRKGDVLRVDMRYDSGVAVVFKPTPELAGL